MFVNDTMGELIDITGSDPVTGDWQHKAFVPAPLGSDEPPLNGNHLPHGGSSRPRTGRPRRHGPAAAKPLPAANPLPAARGAVRQSALEGTYAPLREVLTADDDAPATAEMTEILNYVRMANSGFLWAQEGRPITCHSSRTFKASS